MAAVATGALTGCLFGAQAPSLPGGAAVGDLGGRAPADLTVVDLTGVNLADVDLAVVDLTGANLAASDGPPLDLVGSCMPDQGGAPGCAARPCGLFGWWPFDGTDTDWVNHGSVAVHGAPGGWTYVPGEVGEALQLVGMQWVSVPVMSLPSGNDPRTFELWVNVPAAAGGGGAANEFLVGQGRYDLEGHALWIAVIDGNLVAGTGSAMNRVIGPALTPNAWHHVAVSAFKGGNGQAKIYLTLDGQDVGEGYLPLATDAGAAVVLAGFSPSPGDLVDSGQGALLLDEVTFYASALDTEALASIWGAGAAGKCR
jgi:hypothetical protein